MMAERGLANIMGSRVVWRFVAALMSLALSRALWERGPKNSSRTLERSSRARVSTSFFREAFCANKRSRLTTRRSRQPFEYRVSGL